MNMWSNVNTGCSPSALFDVLQPVHHDGIANISDYKEYCNDVLKRAAIIWYMSRSPYW